MKQAVKNYKKASRALRTFQTEMLKNHRIKYSSDESEEVKARRFELHKHVSDAHEILDQTLGADALTALYWEGKELS